MLHRKRIWTVVPVEGAETLAEYLTQRTWCCCNGFRLEDYLFVNDATCADRVQEYAALKPVGDHFVQIESLTFSWMNTQQAFDVIRQVLAGEFDQEHYGLVEPHRIQTPAEHGRCQHCA
jgi:hypothetical protein